MNASPEVREKHKNAYRTYTSLAKKLHQQWPTVQERIEHYYSTLQHGLHVKPEWLRLAAMCQDIPIARCIDSVENSTLQPPITNRDQFEKLCVIATKRYSAVGLLQEYQLTHGDNPAISTHIEAINRGDHDTDFNLWPTINAFIVNLLRGIEDISDDDNENSKDPTENTPSQSLSISEYIEAESGISIDDTNTEEFDAMHEEHYLTKHISGH